MQDKHIDAEDCVENEPAAKPMTAEQRFRQEILMYVRDKILNPIMPPVKKHDAKLNVWLKSRDWPLIDKLTAKHTDELLKIITTEQLAILERLLEKSETMDKPWGDGSGYDLVSAVPLEAIQQQIDRIGGKNG